MGKSIKINITNKGVKTEMKRLTYEESVVFGRRCYGYGRDAEGYIFIKDDEAEVIRMIYKMSIDGHSLHEIQSELLKQGIKSPSGKDKWTRDVIDKIINNNKYIPHVVSFDETLHARGEKSFRCRNDKSWYIKNIK